MTKPILIIPLVMAVGVVVIVVSTSITCTVGDGEGQVVPEFGDAPSDAEVEGLQAASNSFADELQPGKVLHRVQVRYQRHGPVADSIASRPCALPERTYAESWIKIGQDGFAYERRGRTTDVDGNVFMTSQTSNGETVSQYANCDREIRIPYTPYSLQDWARRAENAPQKLADLGLEKVGEGIWDGKETTIHEKSYEYFPSQPATGYRLPYAEDLDPQSSLERYELVAENPLIQRLQRWAADAGGNKTLIYEKVTTLLEVVDP